jgi:predicted transcriptional regulator
MTQPGQKQGSSDTFKREEMITEVARRYCMGVPQVFIARALGVNQSTVSRYLKIVRKRWLVAQVASYDTIVAEYLARVDNLEREYWEAWVRSLEVKQTTVSEKVDGNAAHTKASVRKEDRLGDPRFLEGVRWCLQERAKVLGLYAPIKQDVTHDFSAWTDEELEREIIAEAERITGGAAAARAGKGRGAGAR